MGPQEEEGADVAVIKSHKIQVKTHKKTRVASKALLALTASAMTLPGMQAQAAVPPEKKEINFRYSGYSESALSEADVAEGSLNRYDIDVMHAKVIVPYKDSMSFSVDLDYETMSGASPWYNTVDSDGNVKAVMSGASIDDTRIDVVGAATVYHEKGWLEGSLGTSSEEDYQSYYGGMGYGLEFYGEQLVLDAGLSFSSDELTPTGSTITERKSSFNLYFGMTQILNKFTVFKTGVNFGLKSGYLSDPYKLSGLFDEDDNVIVTGDSRPDERRSFSWVSQGRYFYERFQAALHGSYRYYQDSWGLVSHTIEGSWNKEFNTLWDYSLGMRWYSQVEADFYRIFYVSERPDGFYSNDYRLSEYDALSYRGRVARKLTGSLTDWKVMFAYEFYTSSGSHPAMLDYQMMTVGIDYQF